MGTADDFFTLMELNAKHQEVFSNASQFVITSTNYLHSLIHQGQIITSTPLMGHASYLTGNCQFSNTTLWMKVGRISSRSSDTAWNSSGLLKDRVTTVKNLEGTSYSTTHYSLPKGCVRERAVACKILPVRS